MSFHGGNCFPFGFNRCICKNRSRNEESMSIPAPTNDNGSGSSTPFLKPMHVSKKGFTTLTLLGKPVPVNESQYGQQLLVPIKIGAKEYTFAIKVDSGNHARLYRKFGSNEKKWKGPVKVQLAEHMGNQYIQVAD
jgi:hypothetical protein